MATVSFTVPNQEQSDLLREMGIDPDGYAIMTDNEDTMTARHLKTRHDIFISKNRYDGASGRNAMGVVVKKSGTPTDQS